MRSAREKCVERIGRQGIGLGGMTAFSRCVAVQVLINKPATVLSSPALRPLHHQSDFIPITSSHSPSSNIEIDIEPRVRFSYRYLEEGVS